MKNLDFGVFHQGFGLKLKNDILGLFHVGCCCQRNITCGFEIMLVPESSHNFARLALCRDLNMRRCEGFVFDFGCNLHNYLLNREPREFEFKRVLVDSFHYQNHNSCSSSYDASQYKKYLPQGFYTTGREQINSKFRNLRSRFGKYRIRITFSCIKCFSVSKT